MPQTTLTLSTRGPGLYEFTDMARERTGQGFEAWLARVTTSDISELDRFARGLTDDRAAVGEAQHRDRRGRQPQRQRLLLRPQILCPSALPGRALP